MPGEQARLPRQRRHLYIKSARHVLRGLGRSLTNFKNVDVRESVADLASDSTHLAQVGFDSKSLGVKLTQHVLPHQNVKDVCLPANNSRKAFTNRTQDFAIDITGQSRDGEC